VHISGYNVLQRVEEMQNLEQSAPLPEPLVLADHPALDFLNTIVMVNGELVDFFQTDAEVLRWLEQLGFSDEGTRLSFPSSALLVAAQTMREDFRRLLEKRKLGKQADPSVLNSFLAAAESYPQLVWPKSHSPVVERVRQHSTPEQILAPVAESAADLLTTGDFDLVRRCEDEFCVLWFYDRTKSHHRRWCSMTTCGNRNKVAAYRRRNNNQT
jgi:predicted RNA-binding Zn ribbon-like protein